ncbi:hypothetical protein D477_002029 [Arthrobacter crystallopoietes BAB-32]|uniref:DUF3099 domain-containing protein n=1 Tax=Arthrobacter crystallopoietes BAB-32 TaxID=1246476 RepID=N1UZV9_9MICC|nr:DUF3099 domain-containing protein [Arthrobacter crystallopoietes]EMY35941.1 hypothetical protein D477_002029 [Arthrobacter crystallopoietes BAB-32]
MSKQPNDDRAVQSITDVPEGHSDEMRRRMVKYTVAMSIRLACLLLFFFVDGWMRWLLIAGAVFLPWIAVVIANAGGDQSVTHSDALLDRAPVAELESGAVLREPEADVLPGEIIDDDGDPVPHSGEPGAAGPAGRESDAGSGTEDRTMDERREDGDAA